MYDLTITIIAYHNYSDILKAVKSIETYTSANITKKIYIVDNSVYKKDNTIQCKFEKKLSKYADVELIKNKKNVGFGKGHNIVLDKIDSKYHAIVNPDILLQEDSFSAIIKYMEEQQEMGQEVGMVIPRLIDEHGELLKVYRRELTVADLFIRMFLSKWFQKRQAYHTMQNKNYKKEFQVPFGQGSFLVIRTALFKQLKGFDDRYFMYMEDADLCKRVNQVSKFMYFPNTSVIHKWERGSHKNIKLFQYHIQSMIRYFNKWGWKWL